MDVEWPQYAGRVFMAASAMYGFAYMISAVGWPEFFLSNLAVNRTDNRGGDGRSPWWLYPLVIFTALCVGMVLYGALYPVINAIPFSWGSHDEDGEWASTRNYVQMTGAIIGAIGIMASLEKVAETLVWGPIERKARNALADAIAHYKTEGDTVRQAAERNLREKLGPQKYEAKSLETEWRDDLREAIIRRLASRY